MAGSNATVGDVRDLLLSAYPQADVSDVREEGDFITGIVRWPGFQGMDNNERYRLLQEKVRLPLGSRGMNLGTFYLLTPKERL